MAARNITLKNTARGARYVHDASGKQVLLGPGQEREVEVNDPVAKQLEEASRAGSTLQVSGCEPKKQERPGPVAPDEHKSRSALAEAEAKRTAEGQEKEKARREAEAKKPSDQLAGEPGIHMHERPAPAPAPDPKKAPQPKA